MTTTPPDDDFDNALAVFTHDVAVLLPEDACRILTDRIRVIHADRPDLDFAAAVELARAFLAAREVAVGS